MMNSERNVEHSPSLSGHDDSAALQWHRLPAEDVLARLRTDPAFGLSEAVAAQRLAEHGPNELIERGGKAPWRILWEQFTATMVLILIVAAILSALVGDLKDAGVILAIVVLFGVLGFVQEYRAERAMAALKRLAVPTVRVRRGGAVREISARELVPGDIVLLEAGAIVPADARIIESANLRAQEAALTGESEPVEKASDALTAPDLPLADRRNMLYMGTTVTYGRGIAVVVATGMATELGRIATMLQSVRHELTPLQRRLDQLGKAIGVVALAVAALIFALGAWRGEDISLMFMTAVSVAVAAVPEGLPAVVTITLAIGAQRMLRRNALLRKLPAVETLGSVTVICSDKTGTLTENRMTVADIVGFGAPMSDGNATDQSNIQHPTSQIVLLGAALCNDAVINGASADHPEAIGDPTETALLVAAQRAGLHKAALEALLPRVAEVPFDSQRKRMTTIHRVGDQGSGIGDQGSGIGDQGSGIGDQGSGIDAFESIQHLMSLLVSHAGNQGSSPAPNSQPTTPGYLAFTKGAVDGLLDLAAGVLTPDGVAPMTHAWRDRLMAEHDRLAQNGMRVLGVALRPLAQAPGNGELAAVERDLIIVGLLGMIDPPRAEVKDAVATCRAAGIRPIMITGDHALTALYIAREIGISSGERVLTGRELEAMSDRELESVVEQVSVFARVAPEHKLRIVRALQARGHVVAMTGDGVNDAPALKQADIGVAMGITGTDVSKEAAEMVLRDDNFATIVAAVEEGRVIYDNLRKFIKFSIAGNIGKVLTVLIGTAILGPLLGMPLVLLPLQLLWLNLLTDGLLGLGLGVERAERNVMRRAPIAPDESIFARGMGRHIVWLGLLIGGLALALGVWAYEWRNPAWQTMLFTALAFAQIGQALAIRSTHDALWTIGIGSNRVLLGAAILVAALQLLVIYWSPLAMLFGTTPLDLADLLLCVAVGVVVWALIEGEKWWTRRAEALRQSDLTLARRPHV